MIVFHPNLSSKFEEFSIPIPVKDDRSAKVADALGIENLHLLPEVPLMEKSDLLLVHDLQFVEGLYSDKLYQYMHDCFEFSKYVPTKCTFNLRSFLDHIVYQVSATYYSMQKTLDEGFVFHLGGGMHHAHSDRGRGFCLLNDIIIGLRKLQKEGKIKTAWVVDVDAHKGDGTAEITKEDDTIHTLSIHMASGWPLDDADKSAPWYIPSTIDIGIEVGEEEQYLSRLKAGLNKMPGRPDMVVIVDGADPYEKDELESAKLIKLSKTQMLERDLLLYNYFKEKNIPQIYLMAGGYGDYAWEMYYQFLREVMRVEN